MDAVAAFHDNIITIFDLKTNERSYYKADGSVNGSGISACEGHNRLPLIAFSEAVLRPSIRVLKYPDLKTHCILGSKLWQKIKYKLLFENFTFL